MLGNPARPHAGNQTLLPMAPAINPRPVKPWNSHGASVTWDRSLMYSGMKPAPVWNTCWRLRPAGSPGGPGVGVPPTIVTVCVPLRPVATEVAGRRLGPDGGASPLPLAKQPVDAGRTGSADHASRVACRPEIRWHRSCRARSWLPLAKLSACAKPRPCPCRSLQKPFRSKLGRPERLTSNRRLEC